MLDTHYPEMRILVGCGAYGAISGRGPDVKALGARIRGVNKRLAEKHHTIGVHKLSYGVLDASSTGIGLLQKYCRWRFSRLQPQPLYGCFGLRVNSFRSMASPIAL